MSDENKEATGLVQPVESIQSHATDLSVIEEDDDGEQLPASTELFFASVDRLEVQDRMTNEQAMQIQAEQRALVGFGGDPYDEDNDQEIIENRTDERIPVMEGLQNPPFWAPLSVFAHYENTKFRAFIRNLFANYTETPVEDIFRAVPSQETQNWLLENTTSKGAHVVDFSKLAPGVQSMVEKFEMEGAGFLRVTDFSGVSLYTWKEEPKPVANPSAPGM